MEYSEASFFDKAGYAHYKRRDVQIDAHRSGVRLDNGYVVPYNRELCMRFYAHINVEYCGWTMLINYLFKYISKGTDRIIARVSRKIGEAQHSHAGASTSNSSSVMGMDEIKNFVDACYIDPHKACWRIFGFDIHIREPAVQILVVHLENMQHVSFKASQTVPSIPNNPSAKKTTLTKWLAFNESSTFGRHLTYVQFPSEFVWTKGEKTWTPRRNLNKPAIGRLAYVHPTASDLFYQHMLLCHQRGCASFAAIQTVKEFTYAMNREYCEAVVT